MFWAWCNWVGIWENVMYILIFWSKEAVITNGMWSRYLKITVWWLQQFRNRNGGQVRKEDWAAQADPMTQEGAEFRGSSLRLAHCGGSRVGGGACGFLAQKGCGCGRAYVLLLHVVTVRGWGKGWGLNDVPVRMWGKGRGLQAAGSGCPSASQRWRAPGTARAPLLSDCTPADWHGESSSAPPAPALC